MLGKTAGLEKRLSAVGIKTNNRLSLTRKAKVTVESPVRLSGDFMLAGTIGAYTYIRYGSRLGTGVGHIGRYCSIAPGVCIGDGNHPMNWLSSHPFQAGERPWVKLEDFQTHKFPPKPKSKTRNHIGNDVWIGTNAIILVGVNVGDGAVIAAGSIVTRDVPPYAIVAGVPARVVRYRFPPETIEKLLKMRWWEYSTSALMDVNFADVDGAIVEINRRIRAGEIARMPPQLHTFSMDGMQAVTEPRILRDFSRRLLPQSIAPQVAAGQDHEKKPSNLALRRRNPRLLSGRQFMVGALVGAVTSAATFSLLLLSGLL